MLRNDLITLLAEKENNAVTVYVNGSLVDVGSVTVQGGSIVLILDSEDLQDTLSNLDRSVELTEPPAQGP